VKVKVALVVFIVLGLCFASFQVLFNDPSTVISEKEAEAMATELYGGKVLNTAANEEHYQISLENDKGIYQLYVDGETEKISDVKLIERKEALLTIEEAKNNIEQELKGNITGIKQVNKDGQPFVEAAIEIENKQHKIEYDLEQKKIVTNQEVKHPPDVSSISEKEAKEIALQQLPGQVTDLSIVTTQTGQHYRVTVDGEEEDAHIYVQSNTGIVTSFSWIQLNNDDKVEVNDNDNSNGNDNSNDDDDNDNNDDEGSNDDNNDDDDDGSNEDHDD
jgi:uncharacterized membrane protein YkoI